MPDYASSEEISFIPRKELLNPNFEAYRLQTSDPDDDEHDYAQLIFDLPGKALSPNSGVEQELNELSLSYKRLKEKFFHRYLRPATVSADEEAPGGGMAYIDQQGFVMLVTLAESKPLYHPVHRLSIDIADPGSSLPSLASLTTSLWLVSDGVSGSKLQLLRIRRAPNLSKTSTAQHERYAADVIAEYAVDGVFPGRTFTVIECAQQQDGAHASVLLQSRIEAQVKPGKRKAYQTSLNTSFEVALVRFELPGQDPAPSSPDRPVEVLGKYKGDEPLYGASFSSPSTCWLFSETHFRPDDVAARQTESSGSSGPLAEPKQDYGRAVDKAALHPAYSWAQTSDTVTIAFSLPAHLTKQNFRVHFSPPHGLSLLLSTEADLLQPKIVELSDDESKNTSNIHELNLAVAMQEGKYEKRTFWAPIDVNGCVWTWEKARSQVDETKVIGLLTLHLEKKDEGTKWTHVFSQSGSPGPALTDDVLETTDPSELLKALEGLEKYTVQEGEESGPGADRSNLLGEQPSLLKDGPEEEDATVGRPLRVTGLSVDSSSRVVSVRHSSSAPSTLLCQPLACDSAHLLRPCLAIGHNVDGCLWSFDDNAAEHIETVPALSYVLASKREAHRCYTVETGGNGHSRGLAFAFEGPTPALTIKPGDTAGNLFYYRGPDREGTLGKQGVYGESRVVKLGNATSGSVIDVVAMTSLKRPTLACLTSTQLLLLPSILR